MIYRLALILLLLATPAHALKMGPMMASSTTYAPSAPVSVSGAAGNGQVTVTWSAGTVDGTHSAATSYNLYRSTSSGAETLWQSGVTSPYVDTASNGTSYYYKVQAVNSAGNALSTEAGPYTPTATVYAPNIPVIGTATAGNAQATVAFTASVVDGTHSAATSYTVTSSPGGFTATGSASPLTVTGLTNGTAYTFTVTATNTAGTSAASSASNSVTPSASTNGLLDFETAGLTPTGLSTAYTLENPTNAVRSTALAHTGTYSMAFTPATSPMPQLYRNVTLPSSGTVTYDRWFAVSALGNTTADFNLFSLAPDSTPSAWGPLVQYYDSTTTGTGGTAGGIRYVNGTTYYNLYSFQNMSANTWYRVSIVLHCDTNKYDIYVYNAAGTQLASALTKGGWSTFAFSGSRYIFGGRSTVAGAPTYYFDDFVDGL